MYMPRGIEVGDLSVDWNDGAAFNLNLTGLGYSMYRDEKRCEKFLDYFTSSRSLPT